MFNQQQCRSFNVEDSKPMNIGDAYTLEAVGRRRDAHITTKINYLIFGDLELSLEERVFEGHARTT